MTLRGAILTQSTAKKPMWDEIQDMPGEIFDVILDLEDFLDAITEETEDEDA